MRKKPEILAPAGSMDSLKAAISAGCDAVYMGGMRFGARAYADNPDQGDLVRAIEYAHLHDVKLYLTVNTLLKDTELYQGLYEYMLPYYEAGLDAAIVQDVGVMRTLHRWFPDLDLHASTQMNLVMGAGAEPLRDYGVTRIVPARELSLPELVQMRLDTGLELEVFVHGALCYCYSGRCLFSSMQGGRSGNRGRCTQPCRMLYHGLGDSGYYLSPKELCALPCIPQLVDAGIDSCKIEGRMKRPEYTAQVTALYRYYVDLSCELGQDGFWHWQESHQEQWAEDLRKLAELYNREGFTHAYLTGDAGKVSRPGSMLSLRRPRHGGVRVGEVLAVYSRFAVYRLERDIAAQDVVEFRDPAGRTVYEYTVGEDGRSGEKIQARYQKGCRIRVGDGVYRTRHSRLLQDIRQKYLLPADTLPVTGEFMAAAGQACILTVRRQSCTVSVAGDIVEEAANQPAAEESVRKAVEQTGDSIFYFSSLKVRMQGRVFLPVGMIKRMRRRALQQLTEALLETARRSVPEESGITEKDVRTGQVPVASAWDEGQQDGLGTAETYSAAVMALEQLDPVLDTGWVTEVILRMDQMTEEELDRGAALVHAADKKLILGMPAVWRESVWRYHEEQFRQKQGVFYRLEPDGYLIQNMESFVFLQKVAGITSDRIRADASLYIMNQEAVRWWQDQGVLQMTAPWELTGQEWRQSEYRDRQQIILYGHIPLMVSAQCVVHNTGHCVQKEPGRCRPHLFWGEKNRQYLAVNYCEYCYTIIYQGRPFSIQRELPVLRKAGFSSWRYEFSVETAEQVREVLDGVSAGKIESGHYDKGVF